MVRPRKEEKDKKHLLTFRLNYNLWILIKNTEDYNKKVENILNDNIDKFKEE
ncbi:hypothetical protein KPL40_19625 [Clostridium gasigenes]|uniref:hypothetical protein n=1 Tax=Clostridium gasigenes TaxID=94869 RepID=UPI001C0BC593|nr:hypothetical protein [Clostridium gasigenes]MBU3134615.1 hypothetical protein [Clostridium gasigenes]